MSKLSQLLFREGNISTSFRHPSAGMTNVSVALMEHLSDKGYHIYTNVEFLNEVAK